MRKRHGQQRSSDDIPTETEAILRESWPHSSSPASEQLPPSSPSKNSNGKSSKFSCAFNALKCSSRASEDERSLGHFPVLSKKGNAGIIDDCEGTGTMSPQANSRTVQQRRPSEGYESDASSRLVELSGLEAIDHAPFEDSEEEEGEGEEQIHVLRPSRTSSDDTHDTPNTSNRGPNNSKIQPVLLGRFVPDSDFDEFCQSNFNTPRMLHSRGSLGDSITPLVSPDGQSDQEEDDGESFRCSPRRPLDHDAKSALELPNMHSNRDPALRDSILSYASSTSFLVGETIAQAISEEQQVPEEKNHITISREISRPLGNFERSTPSNLDPLTTQQASAVTEEQPRPERDQSLLLPEESSGSSVSTFIELLKQKTNNEQSKASSRQPPFFWRTHPTTTLYSYDFQQPHRAPSRHVFPTSDENDGDFVSVDIDFPVDTARTWIKDRNIVSFNPTSLRDMWTTSQHFGWHAANKFAAAFTAADSTRLRSS